MEIKITTLDIPATKAAWPGGEFLPAYVVPRGSDKHVWYVLDQKLAAGGEPSWSISNGDEYVRIPVFAYNLSPRGDRALAFMLQLGLSVVGHLSGKITHLHIVTGTPVELLYDTAGTLSHMSYWVGFAAAIKE